MAARLAAGQPEAWKKWHDLFAQIEGPAARDLQRVFAERWAVASGEELSPVSERYYPPVLAGAPLPDSNSRVKVLANAPGLERDVTAEIVRLFSNAQTAIQIANPYFTDDLLGLYLVHTAGIRRIPVDLIVPDEHHDLSFVRTLMQMRYQHYLAAGVRIFEYRNHFTHVKLMTSDSRYVCLGSYNYNVSSAARDYECNILIDDPVVARDVETRLFDVDRAVSRRIIDPPQVHLAVGVDLLEPSL